ncbi:hypothetical protein HDV00_000472 [Rhizophlyctis rosea]|nr:hypothetical protein HDV00_000472 [Rhizophlyctis rosea]
MVTTAKLEADKVRRKTLPEDLISLARQILERIDEVVDKKRYGFGRVAHHILSQALEHGNFPTSLCLIVSYLRGDLAHLPTSDANIPVLMALINLLHLPCGTLYPVANALDLLILGTLLKYGHLLQSQSIENATGAHAAKVKLEACIALESKVGTDGMWIIAHAHFELAELEWLAFSDRDCCVDGLRRIVSADRVGAGSALGSRLGESVEVGKSPSASIVITDASSPPSLSGSQVFGGGRNFSGGLGPLPSFVTRREEDVGGSNLLTSPSSSGLWRVGSPSSVYSHASASAFGSDRRRYPFRSALRQRCQVALQEVSRGKRDQSSR